MIIYIGAQIYNNVNLIQIFQNNLSNVTSLEPPPASLIIKEFLIRLLWHLVVLFGNVPPPNVNLNICETKFEDFLPLLLVSACLSLCNFPPPNQPTCMIET